MRASQSASTRPCCGPTCGRPCRVRGTRSRGWGSSLPWSGPTLEQSSIPVHNAAAWVAGSFEVIQDAAGLDGQVAAFFRDAFTELENSAFTTGTGSNQPTGIVTALDAAVVLGFGLMEELGCQVDI
jgi:HK97 family phage major capsid protein